MAIALNPNMLQAFADQYFSPPPGLHSSTRSPYTHVRRPRSRSISLGVTAPPPKSSPPPPLASSSILFAPFGPPPAPPPQRYSFTPPAPAAPLSVSTHLATNDRAQVYTQPRLRTIHIPPAPQPEPRPTAAIPRLTTPTPRSSPATPRGLVNTPYNNTNTNASASAPPSTMPAAPVLTPTKPSDMRNSRARLVAGILLHRIYAAPKRAHAHVRRRQRVCGPGVSGSAYIKSGLSTVVYSSDEDESEGSASEESEDEET
ncbi:hypothetical protein HGRIS_013860 [Hohenbuehelia grisea]|uniref:Uncharacterized protein n=1 Tax=Hohenbuehelia grisea TaxID=104357 RepID=A0ABR3IX32_9AGAR